MFGFADVSRMRPRIRETLGEEIQEEAEMLERVVMKVDRRCLGKEIFEPTFWKKLRHCFIL